MILEAIGKSLPMAVGVALSPIPVAAVIMILMAAQARTSAPAFLLGWMLGILTVGFIVFLVPGIDTARGEPTALSGLIRIVLGITLLLLAVRQWYQRSAADALREVPKVFADLDQMGVIQSSVTGFLLSSVHPKNLVLSAAGAAAIDASMLDPGAQVIALLLFSVIASLTIAIPVAGYFLVGPSAEAMFRSWKDWLVEHNATMITTLLLIFGALLIGRGMKILAV
jgi:hypothetical protein